MMKTILKRQRKAGLAVASALLLLYGVSVFFPSGSLTHLPVALPAAVIGTTALARVNDMSQEHVSKRWQLRRVGLILAGVSSMIYILKGLSAASPPLEWRELLMLYGVAFTWITTPDQPPWWQYVTGEKSIFKRKTND